LDFANDTTIQINETTAWRIHTECKLQKDTLIEKIEVTKSDNIVEKIIHRGYEVVYRVQVWENEEPRLDKSWKKGKLAIDMVADLLVGAFPQAPEYLRYNPKFKQLIFQIPFYFPESDDGIFWVFSTDMEGNIGLSSEMSPYSDYQFELSDNGQVALCGTILYDFSTQKKTTFARDTLQVLGSRLVNDQAVLVIFEKRNRKDIGNATLFHKTGQAIEDFDFSGYIEEMGYSVFWQEVRLSIRPHLLLWDPKLEQLVLIDKRKGQLKIRKLSTLRAIPEGQAPTASDQVVHFIQESDAIDFFIDPQKSEIIYRKNI
jgi:hypothetical protein